MTRTIPTRSESSEKAEDLELLRDVPSLPPEGHTDRPALMSMKDLGAYLIARSKQGGSLNESISLLRAALELQTDGDSDRASSLYNFAISVHMPCQPSFSSLRILVYALRGRFEQKGNVDDLHEAIHFNRLALDVCPQGHLDLPFLLTNLAGSLHSLFEQGGDVDGLDESIRLYRKALRVHPEGHFDRSSQSHGLGNALMARFGQFGGVGDLSESVQMHRCALDLRPERHPDRSASFHSLGNALLARFRRSGKTEDLDEAILSHRTAVRLHPEEHRAHCASLHGLGVSLLTLYERDGGAEVLGEAIMLNRDVLYLLPEGHLMRCASYHSLACCLLARFERNENEEDLDEAISLYRVGVLLRREGHPGRSAVLHGLGNALLARFKQNEAEEDLNEAISLHRTAMILRPDGHPERSTSLHSLGNSLLARFTESGAEEDLEEAIALFRDALRLSSDGHPDRSMLLHSLGKSLMARFERRTDAENLEKVLKDVVEFQRRAMVLHQQGQRYRSRRLVDHTYSLLRQKTTDDFNEAVALHRAALALCPEGRRSESLLYLADSLMRRFEPERGLYNPDSTIPLFRDVQDLSPEDSLTMFGLERAPSFRFKKLGGGADLEESIRLLSDAASHAFSALLSRLEAAHRWTTLARSHNHDTTLNAYRTAAALLQRTLTIRPTLTAQHDLLTKKKKYQTMSSDAAAYAIKKGNLGAAIEFLEQGRTLLWSQMRGLRTPLDRLSAVDKNLADRFAACCRELEALMTSSESHSTGPDSDRVDVHDHGAQWRLLHRDNMLFHMQHLSNKQEAIISEIRQVPGFEDFLKGASFEQLRQAASEGPVIVLNHSEVRCDALILLPQRNEPCVCVPLDGNWFSDARDLCDELLQSHKVRGIHSSPSEEPLRRTMKVLWDRVVSKVVRKLREVGIAEGSRVWWCPTAFLNALPFHAAGPYEDASGAKKYFIDGYISSYTPTLTSLIAARAGIRVGTENLLFVGDTTLCPAKEIDKICGQRCAGRRLCDKEVTPKSAIEALREAEWAHFVCSGTLDRKNPFKSSFTLPGGELTLLDIARENLPNAEFAFLSACHTAEQPSAFAADEALHLAAAIQFCGFRSVVGTMWKLLEKDGIVLADVVYKHLMEDVEKGEFRFKRAAAGVRKAVLYLRSQKELSDDGVEEVDVPAERWVNLVHIGA